MSKPLIKAAEDYILQNKARFHTPGHKGRSVFPIGDFAKYDLTEINGLDSLYTASGPIAEAEAEYSRLYGSKASFLSAGGSTLCIQAMLALAGKPGGEVVAARGAHTSAVNAMALLDLNPVWVYPQIDSETGLACAVTAEEIEAGIKAAENPCAVFITSPVYTGIISDIKAIKEVCSKYGVPLLVDNAHGAHLKFTKDTLHPLDAGADMCCDSLHKTMPVLTGGAVLHVNAERFIEDAKHKMALFGSTSPSYLTMLSMDYALPYIKESALKDVAYCTGEISRIKYIAAEKGFKVPRGIMDPLRLTINFADYGYTQMQYEKLLQKYAVEPEYMSSFYAVFLAGAYSSGEDFKKLESLICGTPRRERLPCGIAQVPTPKQGMTLRQAMFAQKKTVPLKESAGRICAGIAAPCPPGIPIIMPGEIINENIIELLKNNGILYVNVVE